LRWAQARRISDGNEGASREKGLKILFAPGYNKNNVIDLVNQNAKG